MQMDDGELLLHRQQLDRWQNWEHYWMVGRAVSVDEEKKLSRKIQRHHHCLPNRCP